MDGADLVGGEILVVGGLETEGSGCFIGGADPKLCADPAPGQLLVGDPIIAAALDDVIEDLQKVELVWCDLGLRVKPRASLGVEVSQLVDEIFVLGSAIDDMLGGPLRHHRGRLCPRRGARERAVADCPGRIGTIVTFRSRRQAMRCQVSCVVTGIRLGSATCLGDGSRAGLGAGAGADKGRCVRGCSWSWAGSSQKSPRLAAAGWGIFGLAGHGPPKLRDPIGSLGTNPCSYLKGGWYLGTFLGILDWSSFLQQFDIRQRQCPGEEEGASDSFQVIQACKREDPRSVGGASAPSTSLSRVLIHFCSHFHDVDSLAWEPSLISIPHCAGRDPFSCTRPPGKDRSKIVCD